MKENKGEEGNKEDKERAVDEKRKGAKEGDATTNGPLSLALFVIPSTHIG